MSTVSKVVWSEGMFLRHQHFQQNDRNRNFLLGRSITTFHPNIWGFSKLTVDAESTKLGKFALLECAGVFPDSTIFDTDENADIPPAITLPTNAHNCVIYLAIPLRSVDLTDTKSGTDDDPLARYESKPVKILDNLSGAHDPAEIFIGKLQLHLLTDYDDLSQFVCVPVARVIEIQPNGGILLDRNFIPSTVNCACSGVLQQFLLELQSLVFNRSKDIASRMGTPSGMDNLTDFMLLQLVNRYSPFISHLSDNADKVSPLQLYECCLMLAGELSTYSTQAKSLDMEFHFLQNDLTNSFIPVMQSLRLMLSSALEQTAYQMDIQQSKQGIWVSLVKDRNILMHTSFILAIKAEMPINELTSKVQTQVKVGPIEKIRSLINLQLVGIELRQLSVIPRELPYRTGFIYFEFDKNSPLWPDMAKSNAFAVHFSGDFPGLEVEMWAIKE